MKLHKLVRYIYIHMYFCWGSSLILQAMGPSFSNFLVWCLESRNKEHSISPPFSFGKATTRMQGEYSTGFPQNPWFVGLMGWHLHQKFFTKIVETKDQNGPKSQAGVVDYGHEPDVGWCGMALPLLFTFTSWGFFQVDTKFIAKAKKGQCVECKVAGFYWAINAVRSTNLHSVVVVCCCAVLYGEGATKKKNTFMHLYHIWKSDTGHSQTHDEHDGSHKNIHHFWKKMKICNPTVHPNFLFVPWQCHELFFFMKQNSKTLVR